MTTKEDGLREQAVKSLVGIARGNINQNHGYRQPLRGISAFERLKAEWISNAFIAKYGKPLTDEIKTISNHMGAEFDSRVLEWVDDTSVLLLKERSRKISNSNARFSLKQNIEDMGKRFEEDAAKRANDL